MTTTLTISLCTTEDAMTPTPAIIGSFELMIEYCTEYGGIEDAYLVHQGRQWPVHEDLAWQILGSRNLTDREPIRRYLDAAAEAACMWGAAS